jgi:mRNA-degrading endonuclease RelE of RelBE toxin-antitoxin system
VFTIRYAAGVVDDLAAIRAFDRRQLLDEIERQLSHEPTQATRRRKLLRGLTPPWEHTPPVWELRVGQYRVFYDVDEASSQVMVRAVRREPPHKTTEEIL